MAENAVSSGKKVYLVAGKRTPFGKFGGALKSVSGLDLCLKAGEALLADSGVKAESIDQVIIGNVIPSTTETIYVSRHLGLHLGIGVEKGAYNVNRLCGSGIQSILDAYRLIKLDEASCVLAGGMEHMSSIPHLVYGARFGTKYGPLKNVDMLLDTLTDKYTGKPMAITAENMAKKYDISREECDEFAYNSHLKAKRANDSGLLDQEITPIEMKRKTLSSDEHVRGDVSLDELKKLRASFVEDGVVTAASASGIVDGAALVLIASEEYVKENNLKPLAEIIDGNVIGVDPSFMGIGPVPCINKLLKKNKLSNNEIDLYEINEAFAAQVLSCQKELNIPDEKLNIWGGAISRGHPLGATGSRIALTLSQQLKSTKKKYGVASACIGGGQGIALLLKNEDE